MPKTICSTVPPMLKVLQARVLSAVLWGLTLYSMRSLYMDWTFHKHAGSLLQLHRDEVVMDLGSVMSPDVCIVAERGCNSGLFDRVLQNHRAGLIVSRGGSLLVDSKLTESYNAGKDLPKNYRYYIVSPFVCLAPFRDREHFVTEYRAVDRVAGGIKRAFFDLVRFLDQSGYSLYEQDGLHFRKVSNKNFTHIRAYSRILGSYEQTRYRARSRTMEDIDSLGRELRKMRQGKALSSFMTEVTQKMLDHLVSLGIFRDRTDLEMFPDLVPILFPYKMTESRCSVQGCSQLVTVGFDLRGAVASHLGFLFDAERVSSIVRTGGMYICTVVA